MRIELSRVTRRFGPKSAVAGLDLTIESGELCVLVGPSGCGKSTTLRCIAGLEAIDHGDVRFDGRSVLELDPVARNVAMVFQSYALYPHMTVANNIAFPLRMRRVPRAEIGARVERVATTLGLLDLLDRRPRQLSGGQQQRVALARALVRDPAVFLLDEPLSNLDARLRLELRDEIQQLHRTLGTTMVYVTHDQAEAMVLGDRIAVMHDGVLQQVGTPEEVYERPANRFVAAFIGSPPMNLWEVAADRGPVTLWGHPLRRDWPESGSVTVGLRPHDLRIATGQADAKARLRHVEQLGHETLVHVEHDGRRAIAWAPGWFDARPGATVALCFDPRRLHVFDGESGARID